MTSKAPRSAALKWMVRVAIAAGGLLVAVVAASFIFVFTFDVDRYRSELEATASRIVGRAVTIEGPMTLGRSLVPKLVAHDVRVANPAWASRLYGARAERLEIELELLPLFNSQLKVMRIALIDFDVLLETSGSEENNWSVSRTDGEGGIEFTELGVLELRNVTLGHLDGLTGKKWEIEISTFDGALEENAPIEFEMKGTARNLPFQIALRSVTIAELLNGTGAIPFEMSARVDESSLEVSGLIERPIGPAIVEARFSLAGGQIPRVDDLFGVSLPKIGPYNVSGRLTSGQDIYEISDLDVRIGQSDLSGHVAVTTGGTRPRLSGRFDSAALHLEELFGVQESGSVGTDNLIDALEARLPVEALKEADLDIELTVARLDVGATVEFRDVKLTARIDDGEAKVALESASWEGSTVTGELEIDMRRAVPAVFASIVAENLDLSAIVAGTQLQETVGGIAISAQFDLWGDGWSVEELLDTGGARVRALQARLFYNAGDQRFDVSIDIAEAITLEGGRIQVGVDGTMNDIPLEIDVEGGTPRDVVTGGEPWPVAVSIETPGATLEVFGSSTSFLTDKTGEFEIAVEGQQLSALGTLLGMELADVGPYRLFSRLTATSDRLHFEDFLLHIAGSDLAGEITWEKRAPRSKLIAKLASNAIDVDALSAAFVQVDEPSAYHIPDGGLPVDVDLELAMRSVAIAALKFEDLSLTATLDNGQLAVAPAKAFVNGNAFSGSVEGNLLQEPIKLSFAVWGNDIDYASLLDGFGAPNAGGDARVQVQSSGVLSIWPDTNRMALESAEVLLTFPSDLVFQADGGIAQIELDGGRRVSDVNFDVVLMAPSTSALTALAGAPVGDLGPLFAKANLRGGTDALNVETFDVAIGGDVLSARVVGQYLGLEDPQRGKLSAKYTANLVTLFADVMEKSPFDVGVIRGNLALSRVGSTIEIERFTASTEENDRFQLEAIGQIKDAFGQMEVVASLKVVVDVPALLDDNRFDGIGRVQSEATLSMSGGVLRIEEMIATTQAPDPAQVRAQGAIKSWDNLNLDMTVETASLTRFAWDPDVELPPGRPVRLHGTLRLADGRVGFEGDARIGQSAFVADLKGRYDGVRPSLSGTLVSPGSYFHDIFVAADAPDVEQDTVQDEEPEGLEEDVGPGYVFHEEPLPLALLSKADLDLSIRLEDVIGGRMSLDAVEARIVLKDANLSLGPISLSENEAWLTANASVDASLDPPTWTFAAVGESLQFGALLTQLGTDPFLEGDFDFDVELQSAGGSRRKIASNLNGRASFFVGTGKLNGVDLHVLSTDTLQRLIALPTVATYTNLRCIVVALSVAEGVITSDRTLIVTPKMTLSGIGKVDLETEEIDFVLSADQKGFFPSVFERPVWIQGSLGNPEVGADLVGHAADLAISIGELATGFIIASRAADIVFGFLDTSDDENPCVVSEGEE